MDRETQDSLLFAIYSQMRSKYLYVNLELDCNPMLSKITYKSRLYNAQPLYIKIDKGDIIVETESTPYAERIVLKVCDPNLAQQIDHAITDTFGKHFGD